MVICLGRGEDLHMAQLMPLALIVCCFSKIHIGSDTGLPGIPGQIPEGHKMNVCVFVFVCELVRPMSLSLCQTAVCMLCTTE